MLGHLIDWLKQQDGTKVVPYGFAEPMSYRGYYDEVAFEPAENVTFGSMLAHAEAALGATFTAYKGGEYTMNEYTPCWIAAYGESRGDRIGPTLMKLWAYAASMEPTND